MYCVGCNATNDLHFVIQSEMFSQLSMHSSPGFLLANYM